MKWLRWLWHPVTVGIAAFILSSILLNVAFGPARAVCRDGWPSASIGRQGACSWHGGVDRSAGSWRFIICLVAGAGAGFFTLSLHSRSEEKDKTRRDEDQHLPPPSPPSIADAENAGHQVQLRKAYCPKCGSNMRLRLAKQGRNKGNLFWGCRRYPACNGTRDAKFHNVG